MLREIKKGLNKHRDALHSWIRRFNIVNMLVLSKISYRADFKIYTEIQRMQNSLSTLKKNEAGGLKLPHFKTL